ncbi:uncharacterized protein LOC124899462 [Capsicum annuum]|uniref:uncharacterized protein LOC124899462 n=1 Tax=Capsicum annuum TaxID=4072 RepID=UPI001FB17D11|nr:uncharacterized protein LOC124899462 [Capsicum annuum]
MTITSIQILVALAVIHDLEIHQTNVQTILLNGELEEEIYMEQPKSFVVLGKERKLYRYAPELVGNMRAHMRKFASVLSVNLVLECKEEMLNRDMDFSKLSGHMQKSSANAPAPRPLGEQQFQSGDRPRVQVPSSASAPTPRTKKEQWGRFSISRYQNSMGGRPSYPIHAKCGRNHCYRYGKSGHRIKEWTYAKHESRDVRSQTQATSASAPLGRPVPPQGASSRTGGGQLQNQFYALPSRQELETSPDVVTGMLRACHLDVNMLLDLG